MPVQLIVADLDGTVLNEENVVAEPVRQAFRLAREQGVPAVVATGRTLAESTDALEALGAVQYSITMNGALVFDHERQVALSTQSIDRPEVLRIIRLLDSFDDIFFHAYANNQPVCSQRTLAKISKSAFNPAYVAMYNAKQRIVPDLVDWILEENQIINKFYISSQNMDHLHLIRSYSGLVPGVRCLQSMPRGLEIIPATVDKSHAVQLLCDHLGLDMASTLVLGDSENDVGMLKVGGISVAMGNAPDHVKAEADWIAPTNLEHGAAAAIERYVLNRPAIRLTQTAV